MKISPLGNIRSVILASWAKKCIPASGYTTALLLSTLQWGHAATVPDGLESNLFAGPEIAPSPAVICASPTGEVFVGVDKQGSLGKEANHGSIVRIIDSNNDGKADQHTIFAKVDNPRGLISLGNQIIALHSTLKDGKPYNQQISVYTDADNDGIADGPLKPLVTGIGNPKYIQSRGADHCTNNIRLGIDGWIYISVGDFGFVNAEGSDGKTLTMHGGGVVRVRPDGSELETFIHGTRNVYDVAIDPFMNVFTRENTNDGIGWWIRFSHYIQSGEYGYPSLYTNFPEDMLPALGEYGGGSGTGCLYLQEPQWPAKYNNHALLADWGRSKIFIHKVKPNGASFTNEPVEFIDSSQVADLDMDASGRMYIAAWAGAGYRGNANKGFVERVIPKDWNYVPFPKLSTQTEKQILELILSPSITIRTNASQELVRRNATSSANLLVNIAKKASNLLESRVAAVYTLAQLSGKNALPQLESLAEIPELREHAIRCMADRLEVAKHADTTLLIQTLADNNPRVQVAAAVALGRTGKEEAATALVSIANLPTSLKAMKPRNVGQKSPAVFKKRKKIEIDADITTKPHATPNKEIILPHVARQALIMLKAEDAVIAGLKSSNESKVGGALATMKWMHSDKVVDALIAKAKTNTGQAQQDIINVLLRLHQRENDYDGSTWWQTRPNPDGPYYYPVNWAGSDKIASFITQHLESASDASKAATLAEMKRVKAYIAPFNPRPGGAKKVVKTIGNTAIEDIILNLQKSKSNAKRGAKIINKVGCAACHNVTPNAVVKGPDLSKLGNMKKDDIAAAIIKPGATIAPSWVTITMNDGAIHTGTIVESNDNEITLHNIAGMPAKLDISQVKTTAPGLNMMSLHLCDSLTLQEFADLVEYIQSMDPSRKKK